MKKIMIIEDDPSVREELASLLCDEGYEPFAVVDFKDIVPLPRRNTASICASKRGIW